MKHQEDTETRPSAKQRVVILGGGMAGVAAAWRLSDPAWTDEIESVTLYQRGWRLGGKGASSRGVNGRIEEHGLHIWLGYYDNAFRVLRECYSELDRERTDPDAPIRTWRDALTPSVDVGLTDVNGDGWQHWIGTFLSNTDDPGSPEIVSGRATMDTLTRRGIQLLIDFAESLPTWRDDTQGLVLSSAKRPPSKVDPRLEALRLAVMAALLEVTTTLSAAGGQSGDAVNGLDRALIAVRAAVGHLPTTSSGRRMWHFMSAVAATMRGVIADELVTDPDGFRRINDHDFLDWAIGHGADPEIANFAFIRGLYDLVFAPGDDTRPTLGVGAGTAIATTIKMFFEYRGSLFWKMQAGMGDVVFAPLHQALVARGVSIRYFHRLDGIHLSPDGTTVDSISFGCQASLANGVAQYDPLIRVRGLPCFANSPLLDQLDAPEGIADEDLESYWCTWPDATQVELTHGEDFDMAVLAVPVDMARIVASELETHHPKWRRMVTHLATTGTVALQLWLRETDHELGWGLPGSTVSAYEQPLSTWASMPQLIEYEEWPDADAPKSIAYFCGAYRVPWPPDVPGEEYVARCDQGALELAREFVDKHLAILLPGTAGPNGTRWDLLCGYDGTGDPLASQYVRSNVDPSDRYVLCVPGSDQYRLRADESGCSNLFLAGDWTDNGINAGCIEAATVSGLQAANAIVGRSRYHRISGLLV